MVEKKSVYRVVITAILCAIGILIPMTFPKISLPPASFTLASHVPIFIAVFMSPGIAAAVCVGTTIGFVFSGLLPVIWMRAATHIVFALVGSLWLKKHPLFLNKPSKAVIFAIVTGLIHAVCEVLIVSLFYFGENLTAGFYDNGFLRSVILLVGVGTVVHSCIDFTIALGIWKALGRITKNSIAYL